MLQPPIHHTIPTIDLADPGAEARAADQPFLLQEFPQGFDLQGHGLDLALKAAQVGPEVGVLLVDGEGHRSGSARFRAAGSDGHGAGRGASGLYGGRVRSGPQWAPHNGSAGT